MVEPGVHRPADPTCHIGQGEVFVYAAAAMTNFVHPKTRALAGLTFLLSTQTTNQLYPGGTIEPFIARRA